jgi:hypothetical protein
MAKFSRIISITIAFIFQQAIRYQCTGECGYVRQKQGSVSKNSNGNTIKRGILMFSFYAEWTGISQICHCRLPKRNWQILEAAAENSLQRRANIILYNNFVDMQQTNIGLDTGYSYKPAEQPDS